MDLVNTPIITTTQIITFIGTVICFGTLTIWAAQNKTKWLYLVPIYIYTLNAFLFYLYLLLDNVWEVIPDQGFLFYTEWSSYIRLQALATVLLYCYMFIDWNKFKGDVKQLWNRVFGSN